MGLPSNPTRSQAAKPILKVVYLFAGKRRHSDVAAFLKKAETEGGVQVELHEFDIERSPQHDLTDNALWDKIFDTLKEGELGFDCITTLQHVQQSAFSESTSPWPKAAENEDVASRFSLAECGTQVEGRRGKHFCGQVHSCLSTCVRSWWLFSARTS